ncbi:terpene synthase family protein [Spirillospora sp. CA-108201]
MTAGAAHAVEDEFKRALESGSTAALAADCQRDLQEWAASFPVLFSARPFDARLFSTVALANAFGAPWESADRLRIAVRASLWVFAADWVVDYKAETRADVERATRECLALLEPEGTNRLPGPGPESAAAETAAAGLARCLSDLQSDLATSPAFGAHRELWGDRLRRYLDAMAREWDWKATGLPDFEQYVANADNFGSSLVNVAHWIFTGDERTFAHLDELWTVSAGVQRVLRLLNDLATYERDLAWGDLNSLMLGVDRATVTDRITQIVGECRERLVPLKETCPVEAVYLERQIAYSTGFYGVTDYWGSL